MANPNLRPKLTILLVVFSIWLCGCSQTEPAPIAAASVNSPVSPVSQPVSAETNAGVGEYTYKIVNTYPHDRLAFTQGFVFQDGIFYEGTGLYGDSTLRKVDRESGAVQQMERLPVTLFGEGITIFGDKLYQLTWKAGLGFVYNKDTFELLGEFRYPTEGWGITHDGARLIMSDGSDTLYFWNPETLEELGRVRVYDDNGPVVRLNELEYINGEVYANVWQTNRIARINPATGRVIAWINLDGLLTVEDVDGQQVDVLNGIAYDTDAGRLFITGKLWPKVFEIELVPVE